MKRQLHPPSISHQASGITPITCSGARGDGVLLCIVVVSVQLATMFLEQRQPSASASASWHDVPFVGSHLQHAHMHLSHFAAHNLFISLAASSAALPAALCLLDSFYPHISASSLQLHIPSAPYPLLLLAEMHVYAGDADADPARSFV